MLSEWIVVLDGDEHSQVQKEVCTKLKPDIKGWIDCTVTPEPEVCKHITAFPAFCHEPTHSCVYGVRETAEEIHALPSLVEKQP